MSTHSKPLEHRNARKVGDVWVKHDGAPRRLGEPMPEGENTSPPFNADAVAHLKALAKAPPAGAPMDGDDYLRWLNG